MPGRVSIGDKRPSRDKMNSGITRRYESCDTFHGWIQRNFAVEEITHEKTDLGVINPDAFCGRLRP